MTFVVVLVLVVVLVVVVVGGGGGGYDVNPDPIIMRATKTNREEESTIVVMVDWLSIPSITTLISQSYFNLRLPPRFSSSSSSPSPVSFLLVVVIVGGSQEEIEEVPTI